MAEDVWVTAGGTVSCRKTAMFRCRVDEEKREFSNISRTEGMGERWAKIKEFWEANVGRKLSMLTGTCMCIERFGGHANTFSWASLREGMDYRGALVH